MPKNGWILGIANIPSNGESIMDHFIKLCAAIRDALQAFAENARAIAPDPLMGKALRGGAFRIRSFLAGLGKANATGGKHAPITTAKQAAEAMTELAEEAATLTSDDPAIKRALKAFAISANAGAARYNLLGSFGIATKAKKSKTTKAKAEKTPEPKAETA